MVTSTLLDHTVRVDLFLCLTVVTGSSGDAGEVFLYTGTYTVPDPSVVTRWESRLFFLLPIKVLFAR